MPDTEWESEISAAVELDGQSKRGRVEEERHWRARLTELGLRVSDVIDYQLPGVGLVLRVEGSARRYC